MEKLLFNTGVKPWNCGTLGEHEEIINSEKHIAFYVEDIPKNSVFMCGCPEFALKEYENKPYYAIRKIIAGGLLSEYAIFRVYNHE